MDEPEVVMALFQILKKTTENFSYVCHFSDWDHSAVKQGR